MIQIELLVQHSYLQKKLGLLEKSSRWGVRLQVSFLTNSCVQEKMRMPLAVDCGLKWSRKTYVCGGTSTPIEGSALLRAAFCGIGGPQVPPSDQPRHGKSHYT